MNKNIEHRNEAKTLALVSHRLTWRMWHPVFVYARSREDAIREALATAPTYIPIGTELYYGMVGGSPVGTKSL